MSGDNGHAVPHAEWVRATAAAGLRAAAEAPAGEPPPAPHEERRAGRRLAVHVVLYLVTIASTWLAGGGLFALTLMTILTCHEAGHYLFAMRHRVPASLPYFIPFPLSPFGTMGAVIAMPARIPHRRALLDIGAAGPIAGFAIALPALMLGMRWSHVGGAPAVTGELVFGDNLVVKLIGAWLGPANPRNDVLVLHPVGFAGYVGSLVTAFNLIPVGQLDGGHVLQALVGRRPVPRLLAWGAALRGTLEGEPPIAEPFSARALGRLLRRQAGLRLARLLTFAGSSVPRCLGVGIVGLLVVMGTVSAWKGWLVWAGLLVLIGVDHPPTTEEAQPLDRRRALVALVCAIVLVLTFVPVPVQPLR